MAIEPNSFEFNLFYAITIIVMVIKVILIVFLAKKMYDRKKETGKITYGFITSVFVLFLCLLVSRILYFYFDFYLTKFDPNKYYTYPAIIVWKIALFISMIGYANFLFVIDQKVLGFKFKGVFSYAIIIFASIGVLYPVNSEKDFEFISILFLVANVVAIVIPIVFFYIGTKAVEYRIAAYLVAIGVILYAIGANIINEFMFVIWVDMFGTQMRLVVYFLALIFKTSGLILFAYGITEFVKKFTEKKIQ